MRVDITKKYKKVNNIFMGLGFMALLIGCKERCEKRTADGMVQEKREETVSPQPSGAPMMGQAELELTKKLHEVIQAKSGPSRAEDMESYEEVAPLAKGAKLKMIALPGGEFAMGSPENEEGREGDEGPRKQVRVEPMWVSEVEIPWALFRAFYENGAARNKDGSLKHVAADTPLAQLISQPTPQYNDMFASGSFESTDEFPAMNMSNHAANKFCQWLSAQTGHFYRLPTEAEWEYAARGGADTAYSWGDDPALAGEFAVYAENSNFTYQKVKQLKPNGYGLYDTAGNVAEWVLDQYTADALQKHKDGNKYQWVVPMRRYPRVFRGGSWLSDAVDLRCAARDFSTKDLKVQDPQVPKSIWYHTNAQHIGFRVVRPLVTPPAEVMHRYWNTDEWTDVLNSEDY